MKLDKIFWNICAFVFLVLVFVAGGKINLIGALGYNHRWAIDGPITRGDEIQCFILGGSVGLSIGIFLVLLIASIWARKTLSIVVMSIVFVFASMIAALFLDTHAETAVWYAVYKVIWLPLFFSDIAGLIGFFGTD